jgi:hypothetical protein
MISIKGHEYHSVQSSYQSHDLTYQSFCKTHVSHGDNALSSISKTNSRGLDAFSQRASLYKERLGYNPKKGKAAFASHKTRFVKNNGTLHEQEI